VTELLPLAGIEFELSGDAALDSRGQRSGLVLLGCLLLSFLFIRVSTRMIRAQVSWWPGNIETGNLHIHHLVFGIVTLMLAGFLGFAFQPGSPYLEILAGAFGVGMGLTLDEFALWLYLDDVYWSEEGRRSIDAVILATIIGGALVLGFIPISEQDSAPAIVLTVLIVTAFALIVAVKGKLWAAVGAMFIPLLGIISSIRLATPDSPWARRFYKPDGRRMARARRRRERHERRWVKFQNLIGGAPSEPETKPSPEGDG
jgi:lysyl-tRNA synthetase class 2